MRYLLFIPAVMIVMACGGSDESSETANGEGNDSVQDSTDLEIIPMAFDPTSIEKGVSFDNTPFNGEEIMSIGWLDQRGQNVIILSRVVEESNGLPSKWIHAAHYANYASESGTEMKLVREVTDYVKECDFDINLNFMDDPILTDIDSNNIAEVTLVYQMACKSDMSEDEMKVIMYEDDKKFGLRGYDYLLHPEDPIDRENFDPNMENSIEEDKNDFFFERGKYKNDNDFDNAPAGFLEHARNTWLKHCFIEL